MPHLPFSCPPPSSFAAAYPPQRRRRRMPDFHPAALRVSWVDRHEDLVPSHPDLVVEERRFGHWLSDQIAIALVGWSGCRSLAEAVHVHDTVILAVRQSVARLASSRLEPSCLAAAVQLSVNCMITLDVLLRVGTCPEPLRATTNLPAGQRLELSRPLGGLVKLSPVAAFGSPLRDPSWRPTYSSFQQEWSRLEEHHLANMLRITKPDALRLAGEGMRLLRAHLLFQRPGD